LHGDDRLQVIGTDADCAAVEDVLNGFQRIAIGRNRGLALASTRAFAASGSSTCVGASCRRTC
jgi:hypothetical protein